MTIRTLTVADLMTQRLLTILPAETLRAAAVRMSHEHVHCLLVPPADAKSCLGVITVKDIVQVLCDGDTPLLDQLKVADAMTTPVLSVQRDFLIVDCLRTMRMCGVRSVVVLAGTEPVGLLSFTDVLRAVANEAATVP